jgi:Tfp pilus assembly protein PilV
MRFDDVSLKRLSGTPLKRAKPGRGNASTLQLRKFSRAMRFNGFALYEVLLGITIFALGVIALGHAVENCLNASTINAEEGVVRQILSNRMAEVQATKGVPEDSKEFKIDTDYGGIKVVQKTTAAELTEPDNTLLNDIYLVTLTAQWQQGGVPQSKQVKFYVYRPG